MNQLSVKDFIIWSEEELIQPPRSPTKSPTVLAIQSSSKSVKFRKLESVPLSTKSGQSGWKDKDTSILPIPCPSDAPDLTKAAL